MPRTPQETFVSPLCDLTLQELVAVGVLTENSKSPLNITLSPPQGINEMLAMKGGAGSASKRRRHAGTGDGNGLNPSRK